MTLKQHWRKEKFKDAADLAEHLRDDGITAEKLEALNAGDLDAVTFREAAAIAAGLYMTVDELLQLSTEKREVHAKELVQARKKAGISQQKAAEIIGDLPGMYQAKERGAAEFYVSELITLAEHMGIQASEILPGARK
ncbi:MAG: helix-turn-helix transcriptional regulator [Bacillota bacterium]|nr:helix-turn-helix transcriptional regulator [Bacillota bacterium]MDW7677701.1 helix-turn-helix transcriptional regulator [Bacillota bacterium]